MRRREFITFFGGAAVPGRSRVCATGGQAANNRIPGRRRFGFCSMGGCFCGAPARTRLDRGPYSRDRVSLVGGPPERYAEIAAEFVRLKVDVIVTVGSAVPIVKQATTAIPIVFAVAIDPVGSGPGRKFGKTRRQRYRIFDSGERTCWKEA